MKVIKIEKRIPFGFVGLWGKLYKRVSFDEAQEIDNEIVELNKMRYVDIGMDMQCKYVDKKQLKKISVLAGMTIKENNVLIETTDSYFDNNTQSYKCIAEVDDLIKISFRWWRVEDIVEDMIFNPNLQSFFYIKLKKVEGKVDVK